MTKFRGAIGWERCCFWMLLGVLGGTLMNPGAGRLWAAQLHSWPMAGGVFVQVEGDGDNDWRLEATADFLNWTPLAPFGTLIGGKAESAPWRLVEAPTNSFRAWRAVRTAGLYDPTLFRTVSLTFTQANWPTLLANGRMTGSNVFCSLLTLDNGATNRGVGARYKGNTSYLLGGPKKSINIEIDWPGETNDLMRYSTINLNNAAGDETLMREAIYFSVMSQYTPCPRATLARVNINGGFWGVYALVQQENGQLISEWFPSNNGDRWRTPNAPPGGFAGSNSALAYLNSTNVAAYQAAYDLRTTNAPTSVAWQRLINTIVVLNTTPLGELRERLEEVMAVDAWLWFLAIENVFADDDSYFHKGADYSFYYEVESGRLHPVEHDGNEAFIPGDVMLSPVFGLTTANRPVLQRLLAIPEWKQRYLAHLRTVLEESFHPTTLTPLVQRFHLLSVDAIALDPNRGFTMTTYSNELHGLRQFITNRFNYLSAHAEVRPRPPAIVQVNLPAVAPTATETPSVTAWVTNGIEGVESVWLYHRGKGYGRFAVSPMLDDGLHGDGAAGDGVYGALTTNYPAGTRVRLYVEARANNPARAASFSPARAEQETHSYRVAVTTGTNSPVILNEVMASNVATLADPQGEFDDWIELRNLTDQDVDLTGRHLSDEPGNPRKWPFPPGSILPANGYLLVWADEDGSATPGLHASFKLAGAGEQLFLTDTDANHNAILDQVTFGEMYPDVSFARSGLDADVWILGPATPGAANP
jgi:hypothetical protein